MSWLDVPLLLENVKKGGKVKCKKMHILKITKGSIPISLLLFISICLITMKPCYAFDIGEIAEPPSLYQPRVCPYYSTYLGGSDLDDPYDIVTDSDGNSYVVGMTSSNNLPMAINQHAAIGDGFVAKFDDLGNLIFVRYIGGASGDMARRATIDGQGNIYIGGFTNSTDFSSTINIGPMGGQDIFVLKINGSGDVQYATRIGGSFNDWCVSLVADDVGNVYLTGGTQSLDFPTTSGVLHPNKVGTMYDGFVVKLDDSGNVDYATYFGTEDCCEVGIDVVVDDNANVYVAGNKWYQTIQLTGYPNVKVMKLNSDGTSAIYSKVIGCYLDDVCCGIAIDNSNNLYVTGYTQSENFPVTTNAYRQSIDFSQGYYYDAFVFKLEQDGALIYSTYLGGSKVDMGRDIALLEGKIIITGVSTSQDFPYNKSYGGTEKDIFVACLSEDFSKLEYSFGFGGALDDWAQGIALGDGYIHLVGYTDSPDFPTINAFQSEYQGGYKDCFVTKTKYWRGLLREPIEIGSFSWENLNAIWVLETLKDYVGYFKTHGIPESPIPPIFKIDVQVKSIYELAIAVLHKSIKEDTLRILLKKLDVRVSDVKPYGVFNKTMKKKISSAIKNQLKNPNIGNMSFRKILLEAINAIEIDRRRPLTPTYVLQGGDREKVKYRTEYGDFSELTFVNFDKPSQISLSIKNGLPAMPQGYDPVWPIVCYNFKFNGTYVPKGFIYVSFNIANGEYLGDPSGLRLLQWDGKEYRDITTGFDTERGMIIGTTDRLSAFAVFKVKTYK